MKPTSSRATVTLATVEMIGDVRVLARTFRFPPGEPIAGEVPLAEGAEMTGRVQRIERYGVFVPREVEISVSDDGQAFQRLPTFASRRSLPDTEKWSANAEIRTRCRSSRTRSGARSIAP